VHEEWDQLEELFPKIEESIKAWFALDKQIVIFEDDLYEKGGEEAGLTYAIIRDIESDPEILKSPSFRKRIYSLMVRSNEARKLLTKKFKFWSKLTSVTVKTSILAFFAWAFGL